MARQVHCDAKLHKYDADVHSSCPWCSGGATAQPEPAVVVPPKPATNNKTTFIWKKSAVPPVVGWLIVVDAPEGKGAEAGLSNRGRDYRLLPNRNRIGRDKACEVSLAYGDLEISGEHCALVYDAVNNAFYLQPGDGRNLTYILEKPASDNAEPAWTPVLAVRELQPRDTIRVGKTLLSFIPFCWPGEFIWDFSNSEPAA